MGDSCRQVSWLAAPCASHPPSRRLARQWHSGATLAAYSCGGSRGFESKVPRTAFPFHRRGPTGTATRPSRGCDPSNAQRCCQLLTWAENILRLRAGETATRRSLLFHRVLDDAVEQRVDGGERLLRGGVAVELGPAVAHDNFARFVGGFIKEDHVGAVADVGGICLDHVAGELRRAEHEEFSVVVNALRRTDISARALQHLVDLARVIDGEAAPDDGIVEFELNVLVATLFAIRFELLG